MTRPGIDPANIRRQSTGQKKAVWWVKNIATGTAITVAMFAIASIETYI